MLIEVFNGLPNCPESGQSGGTGRGCVLKTWDTHGGAELVKREGVRNAYEVSPFANGVPGATLEGVCIN